MVAVKSSGKRAPTFRDFLKWTFTQKDYYIMVVVLTLIGFRNSFLTGNYRAFGNLLFILIYLIAIAASSLIIFFIFYSIKNRKIG